MFAHGIIKIKQIYKYRSGRKKMRLVIQRVLQAEVQVNENTVGKINKG